MKLWLLHPRDNVIDPDGNMGRGAVVWRRDCALEVVVSAESEGRARAVAAESCGDVWTDPERGACDEIGMSTIGEGVVVCSRMPS